MLETEVRGRTFDLVVGDNKGMSRPKEGSAPVHYLMDVEPISLRGIGQICPIPK